MIDNQYKKTAVIIVCYNGKEYLPDCLNSLEKQTLARGLYNIIVVDNNSSDDSVAYIKNNFLQILLLENKENLGFAGGNNIGIKRAIEEGYEYIVLLNQDTIVDPNWLEELIKAAELDEKVGLVQSRLMLWPATEKINSIGNEIHFLGFGFTGGYLQRLEDYPIKSNEITYASGAGMLVKRNVFEEAGLFDKEFFMYHEDLDLSWKARIKGYKIVLASNSVVYHKYEFSKSIAKYYYMERNRFIVLLENYKWLTLLLISPALAAMELGLFAFSFKNGWWKEKLKIYKYFLDYKNLKNIFEKRKIIQANRRINDYEIIKNFTGKIKFQEINSPVLKYFANPIFNAYWQVVKRLIFW